MSTVAEADCWEDSLKQVDRDILVMDSEAVYQVVPEDETTSVFLAAACSHYYLRFDALLPASQLGRCCDRLGD
jgi:hypothetical protein